MQLVVSKSSKILSFRIAQILHEVRLYFEIILDEIIMKSASDISNLISLIHPELVKKPRGIKFIPAVQKASAKNKEYDRSKVSGLVKSVLGLVYFITLVYFTIVLLT